MPGKYDALSTEQLIELLEKRDRTKKLGLVWERDELEADAAVDENFVACQIMAELSDKPGPWRNLVIEGDNYDALRWLRMTHSGKVKCIYIDPPYNTGNKDWVYNDRYMDAENRFRQSTWLEFLYRRITLARDLLAEDGVLLVSINDDQRALLELLMNEALPGMKVGSFVWRTRAGTRGEGPYFSQDNEYILVFAKAAFRFGGSSPDIAKYTDAAQEPRGPWTSVALQQSKTRHERPNAYFPVKHPASDIWYPCNPDRTWAFQMRASGTSRGATFEDLYEREDIIFSRPGETQYFETKNELVKAIRAGLSHPYLREDLPDLDFWVGRTIALGSVRKKLYLLELKQSTKPVSSWIERLNSVGENDERVFVRAGLTGEGTKEVRSVFGTSAFNYAKPVSLIRELVRQSTGPGDLVLDFFAGSATTAQAVMELNAEGDRDLRFILVSSTEKTEDDPEKNLCRDVTAERIRRLNASDEPNHTDLAAGFAYLRTREILFEDLDYDLEPADAWTALEALHDLPLTIYNAALPHQVHEGEEVTLVLVDRLDASLIEWLKGRELTNLFVYTFAPGQIAQHLESGAFDIRSVRDTLVKGFQQ